MNNIIATSVLSSLFFWLPSNLGFSIDPVVPRSYAPQTAPNNFSHVADQVTPSIVRVECLVTEKKEYEPSKLKRHLGTGFCISNDGYILTNYHVIEDAEKLSVFFHDEREFEAHIVGFDACTDIALLKIDATDLQPLTFANSDAVRIGEFVIAMGHPYSEKLTFTLGVVSGKNRNHHNDDKRAGSFIQTDAAINPGNSGGPLINNQGEVVGMNSFMVGPKHDGPRQISFAGMGYAISSNCIQYIVEQIQKKGFVRHGFLGLEVHTLDKHIAHTLNMPSKEGVIVTQVEKGSPAEKASIKVGDVIQSVNSETIGKSAAFHTKIAFLKPGQEAYLKVFREGQWLNIKAICGADPQDGKEEVKRKFGLVVEKLSPIDCKHHDLLSKDEALVVTDVVERSPAYYAKIQPGALIFSANQSPVSTVQDLYQAVMEKSKNDVALFLVKNKDKKQFIALKAAK